MEPRDPRATFASESHALLEADTCSQAVRNLYLYLKQRDAKYSLSFLCKRAGIPSTGYFSDVMKGKRTLHAKYLPGISQAFGLSATATELLRLLHALEGETNDDERLVLEAHADRVRKTLRMTRLDMSEDYRAVFHALEVFCAFGLFSNTPRRQDLIAYFGAEQEGMIDRALVYLERMGLIAQGEEHWRVLRDQVVFTGGEGDISHIDYLKLTLVDAIHNLERWFPRRDLSHFEASILSVNRRRLEAVLADFKAKLLELQADLETGEADTLIRFNIQVYPVR